ncbi:hypothetical protein [Tatumella ptyseos]|uniref:Uncharacterized protein n=1 Tax=Tatumella ptyseos TaxID=82987 RepID=A0A2X5NTS7_9GAMM|nr:hypothetical protein [Tatumella ptyseos]SQK76961.1 Uncharacterised protein [Tatumella ptyseos]
MMPFPVSRQNVTATPGTGSDISAPADPRPGNTTFSAVMIPSSGGIKSGEKVAAASDTPAGPVPVTPSDQQSLFNSLQAQADYPARGQSVTTAACGKAVETAAEEGQAQNIPSATALPVWLPVNGDSRGRKPERFPRQKNNRRTSHRILPVLCRSSCHLSCPPVFSAPASTHRQHLRRYQPVAQSRFLLQAQQRICRITMIRRSRPLMATP